MSLLLQFFKDQAKISRPGVSLYLFEALNEISESFDKIESLKVDAVFQQVIELMFDSIKDRKKITFSKIGGMRSNISLLGGDKFDSNYISSTSTKSDEASMIDNHFFYLKNPRSDPEKPFLLFHTELDTGPAVVEYPKSEEPFSTQSYFDENEELLKLVCLLGPMAYSSYGVAYPDELPKYYAPDTVEALEVITNVAFLESSHFNEEKSVSLEGVSIKDFLKNLFASFKKTSKNIRSHISNLKVNYESIEDVHMMANTVVPALYITNHDWPAEIKAIFDPKESSIKLGKYTRNPKDSDIDAVVDLIDKDGRNCIGIIKCKNQGDSVSEAEYKKIH